MIRNYPAIRTLLRKKLTENIPFDQKMHWFHEKGVSIKVDDTDLYTLKKETDGHLSEISEICERGLVYRGLNLLCFMGYNHKEVHFSEIQDLNHFTWDDKTIFMDDIDGRDIYMYHDPKINDWLFSDNNKTFSSYKTLMLNNLYNVMNVDPAFTYHFKLVERGNNSGIYLWTMYDTNRGIEMSYVYVDGHAIRLKVKHQNAYKFEGFEKLEESDFPLIAIDSYWRKIRITA